MAAPNILDSYADVTGHDVIDHLRQLAAPLQGAKVVHVNSTRTGGGSTPCCRRRASWPGPGPAGALHRGGRMIRSGNQLPPRVLGERVFGDGATD